MIICINDHYVIVVGYRTCWESASLVGMNSVG